MKQTSIQKRRLESREEPCAKRLCKTPCAKVVKVKSQSRQLVIILPELAVEEVQAKQRCSWKKKVPAKQWHLLPLVRRNKKIQRINQMEMTETTTQVKAQVMTSKKGELSVAEGVYGKPMLEALGRPEDFVFKRDDDLWRTKKAWVWNVIDAKLGSIVMQCDFTKKELVSMVADLKGDIGVLKSSISQLLAKKTNDVVALNTHPSHHAGPHCVSNYCALNYVAIAAKLLKKKAPHLKLGVIDIDVHAGDGTHQFIEENPKLFDKFVSIHTGRKFFNMNTDLDVHGVSLSLNNRSEVSAQRYIAKVKETLDGWNKAKLDIIIVSCGFDTLEADPEAGSLLGYQMLPVHFREIGDIFAQRKEQIFFMQEGGYNLNETAKAFEYLMKGFRKGRKMKGLEDEGPSSP